MEENKDKNPGLNASYELKRPGLFAVRAILENAKGGWGKFSELVLTTAGVSNRRDFAAYLRLLRKLGWLELDELQLPSSRRTRKTFRYYEITDKGRAFLDLFPKDQEQAENNPRSQHEGN